MKLYQKIASLVVGIKNCKETNNKEWKIKHEKALKDIERDHLPNESGIDSGTKIDIDRCRSDKIVLITSFHHMNENGFYDGWTDHEIMITSDFVYVLDIKISGKNRNNIKDHLHDLFYNALTNDVN